jgi:hypothetical protein
MSFSVSAVNASNRFIDPSLDTSAAPKVAVLKQTATQEIQQLASSGDSASLIASSLGIPISQVDSTLGVTSSSTNQASALLALSSRLNVRA